MHDVYAYGVIAPSTLFELRDEFPAPGGYAEIAGVYPSIGGEAAGGAYVLARLGVATKLDGNRLGDDDSSARVVEALSAAGVDCRAISLDPGVPSVTEVVFASGGARTVFGTYRELAADLAWNEPSLDDIRSSRVVCVDPFFARGSDKVARWCLEADTPYVTVDASPDSRVARHAEVLVISEEFATRAFGSTDSQEVLAAYTEQCCGLVILTRGTERLLYGRGRERSKTYKPFSVEARDTTGAGDSFRAGIIYGMLRGCDDDGLIRIGAAVAALVCQRLPGVLNSPTERELVDFLARPP